MRNTVLNRPLTNYEMASDPAYVEFGRDLLARGQGEIGMHLHAVQST